MRSRKMNSGVIVAALSAIFGATDAAAATSANPYPTRPIRVIAACGNDSFFAGSGRSS